MDGFQERDKTALLHWPDTLLDEAAFRREQDRLSRTWTFLGHSCDVRNDGDWFRTTLATRSVFVQRFGGELRGFENRCAHRSFPLRTADKGNGPIVCGFHHWRYDQEGRAVGVPQCEQLFGKTPKEMGAALTPLQIASCGSLIFGRFRSPGDDESLEQFLGESFPIVEAMWSSAAVPQFITNTVEANWRLCFQIAVEDYHVPAVHAPIWGKSGYLKRENIGYFRFGRHSAFFTNPDPDGLIRMAAECKAGTWRSANYRVFHIFPNLTVNHFHSDRGHWYVMAMHYLPVTTCRSATRAWFYPAPFQADRPWHDYWTRAFVNPIRRILLPYYARKVLNQDSAVCEKLQLRAQQIKSAPVLGGLEERLQWFEESYAEATSGERHEEDDAHGSRV
jgi:phenylpropionate dioxygenase-like ring-hydroxylating dioxygenase large terminal subunit